MPVYEYRCPVCKDLSEHMHSFSSTEEIVCGRLIDDEYCRGVLVKEIRSAPNLSPQSVPSRKRYYHMKKR